MNRIRKHYRHYIMIFLCAASLTYGLLCPYTVPRLLDALHDFGTSVWYYIDFVLDLPFEPQATIAKMPEIDIRGLLPVSVEEFGLFLKTYGQCYFDGSNIALFFFTSLNQMHGFMLIVMFSSLLAPAMVLLWRMNAKKTNTEHGKETPALQRFHGFERSVCIPVAEYIASWRTFLSNHAFYGKILLGIWTFNINLWTIVIEAIAFYFWFIASFDVVHVYTSLYRLTVDVVIAFKTLPAIVWLIVGVCLFDRWRKERGFQRLEHDEMKNRGFLESLSLCIMITATMEAGKTRLQQNMARSNQAVMRYKMQESMTKADFKFPEFPWINFETELKEEIQKHNVYDKTTAELWVREKEKCFLADPTAKNCFGYDIGMFPLVNNDGLKEESIFDVLTTYAQLYWIYTLQTSLIVSSYSIRTDDSVYHDLGNFPLWTDDFFRHKPIGCEEKREYAHIIDYDSLRLGKKMDEENPKNGSFDVGIVVISEIGKERGNMVENQMYKKKDLSANPKNDGWNNRIKLCRHASTIDYVPYFRCITDDQRAASLGADARELFDILHIESRSNTKLHLPFFFIEDLIVSAVTGLFTRLYRDHRYRRGDMTLFMYLYHKLAARLYMYKARIYNTYGYQKMVFGYYAGDAEEAVSHGTYYLSNKKDFSEAYSTDCIAGYFDEESLNSKVGLNDYDRYNKKTATREELKQQHSFLVDELETYFPNVKKESENVEQT